MVFLAIHGCFWSFPFHCLLSALLCGSNMCTKVSSPGSKLEITRLLQPLYFFKSSRPHLRHCVFCSSLSKWGTYLAQTFLRSKSVFRIVCTLPSDMPVQLAISLTDNCASCSTTIFTAATLALVTEVRGRPRWLSWMRRPTGDQEVAGSTPAEVGNILSWRLIMKYFLRSFSPFRWFKKGSCQFLAKECAQYWLTA